MATIPTKSFVELASSDFLGRFDTYADEAKRQFASKGKKVLKALAKEMRLPEGSYDIRWNPGGPAVSGDIILHGESIYVDLSQTCLGLDYGFMARNCKGRQDYTGGPNNWIKWDELLNLHDLATKLSVIAILGRVY